MSKTKQAQKRYFRSMMGAALGYVGSLLAVTLGVNRLEPSTAIAVALSLIPAVFIFMMLVAIWRFVRDTDEAQRHFLIQSMIYGLFAILAVSGGWGLVEMVAEGVPALPVFWLFPLFFFVFGLSTCFGPGRGMGCKG